jgi:hypothetical protein
MLDMLAMNTVNDIFLELGGTGAVAKAISVGHSTASEMRRRQSIPVKYWPALIDHAQACGKPEIDTDMLVRVHLEAASAPSDAERAA